MLAFRSDYGPAREHRDDRRQFLERRSAMWFVNSVLVRTKQAIFSAVSDGYNSGSRSLVVTNYFIKSGYTVTDFVCTTSPPLSATFAPQMNALNPSQFNATISQHNTQPYLSTDAKIGIGVGIGLGVGVLLTVGIVLWVRKRKAQW